MFNFGSMFRDFDDDPFFSSMQETHRHHMQRMQPMFDPGFLALEGPGRNSQQVAQMGHGHRAAHRPHGNNHALQPFGMTADPFGMGFGNVFGNMHNMMANMHQNFDQMSSNPNVHSYSQSSYTSFSSDGAGPPQVYQATSSTRNAPGGVKETRRSVRDSEAGLEKMAVGHHLGERAHIVERSRNSRTQETEEKQDFNNLDEAEADSFNQEWKQTTQQHMNRHAVGSRPRNPTPAITNGTSHSHERGSLSARDRSPMRPTHSTHGGRNRGHSNRRTNDDSRY